MASASEPRRHGASDAADARSIVDALPAAMGLVPGELDLVFQYMEAVIEEMLAGEFRQGQGTENDETG